MTYSVSPPPWLQFFINGLPLTGGKMFTYAAGTTTKQATYTDATGSQPNTNPIILDTNGVAGGTGTTPGVWLGPGLSYKFVLSPSTDTDPPTNPYYTVDNITSGAPASDVYAFSSTGVFIPPAGLDVIHLRIWGGGGAGGGGNYGVGAGGQAGGYLECSVPVVPGTSYTVTVGAGGTNGTGAGGAGGQSSFIGGGLNFYANGGAGGAAGTYATGYTTGGTGGGAAGQTGTSYPILEETGEAGQNGFLQLVNTPLYAFPGDGTLANSQSVLLAYPDRALSFGVNLPGSTFVAEAAATANTTLTLSNAGTTVATVLFPTASGTGTATAASTFTVAGGSKLLLAGPASHDATLAGIAATLVGQSGVSLLSGQGGMAFGGGGGGVGIYYQGNGAIPNAGGYFGTVGAGGGGGIGSGTLSTGGVGGGGLVVISF